MKFKFRLLFLLLVFSIFSISLFAQPNQNPSLEKQISWELQHQEGIYVRDLMVSNQDGIIRLEGEVSNAFVRDRINEIALEMRGVDGLLNLLVIRPVPVTDQHIRQDVYEAIRQNASLSNDSIVAEIHHGYVDLTGEVSSASKQNMATMEVAAIPGVKQIDNQLQIDRNTTRTSSIMEDEIRTRMSWNVYLDESLILVRVVEDKAYLLGVVGSEQEKELAYLDAWVAGIDAVDSTGLDISVWATDDFRRKGVQAKRSDWQINRTLHQINEMDPRLPDDRIRIRIKDGIAKLKGKVYSTYQRKIAEENALNTAGIWYVDNRLKVSPKESVSDRVLQERLEAHIHNQYPKAASGLRIMVEQQEVYLRGIVSSWSERELIANLILPDPGVKAIHNQLKVYPANISTASQDLSLTKNIQANLQRNSELDMLGILVFTENGRVTLSGEIFSEEQRQQILEYAQSAGATMIIDRLLLMN